MYQQQQTWTGSINICNSIRIYNMYLSFSSDTHAQPLTEADCLNIRLILYCMYSMRTARAMTKLLICAASHWAFTSCHVLVSGDAEVPLFSYYPSSKQQMCWSDRADAQADLHLCCPHIQLACFLRSAFVLILSKQQTTDMLVRLRRCQVFIFQLRYTDIFLSKLVGLNNYIQMYFETRCLLQERSLILVRTVCEWIKPYPNLYQDLTSQNILISATGNSSFT